MMMMMMAVLLHIRQHKGHIFYVPRHFFFSSCMNACARPPRANSFLSRSNSPFFLWYASSLSECGLGISSEWLRHVVPPPFLLSLSLALAFSAFPNSTLLFLLQPAGVSLADLDLRTLGRGNQARKVRDELAASPRTRITLDDYTLLCARHGLPAPEAQDLLRALHTAGDVLHFPNAQDPRLRSLIYLHPQVACAVQC